MPARRRRASSARSTSSAIAEERDPALEERGDGDLVRGVERARVRAAALARLAREREQRERLEVGLVELEREPREVERRHRRGRALRVGERVRDRDAHVGIAEVRERGAVAEADERVHGRRRVDDAPRSGRTSSPNRKCASISSRPLFASVAESTVIFGPIRQVGCASASSTVTRSSSSRLRPRNGPPDAVRTSECDGVGAAALEALERRRECSLSTGIRRAAAAPARGERELAGGDEALLVREREVDAALERPQRRGQPGEADDRVQDEVGLGGLEQRRRVAADLDVLDAVRRGERREVGRARRERAELELGMRGDDLERLAADRAGGAEQGDALHPASVGAGPLVAAPC